MSAATKLIAPLLIIPFYFNVSPASPAQTPLIETSEILHLNVADPTPLRIRLSENTDIPQQSSILIRGLPIDLNLTKGRLFESGAWYVSVGDLSDLMIAPSASKEKVPRRIALSISLLQLDGTVLAERKMILDINTSDRSPTVAISTGGIATSQAHETIAAKPPPAKPSIPKDEEKHRLDRGRAALELNDIAGARLIFEYLATHGSASGAYYLAQTYDPELLPQTSLGPQFKPDANIAARWYSRAAELGHPDAKNRIAKQQ